MWKGQTEQDKIGFIVLPPEPSEPSDDEDEGIDEGVPLHQPSLTIDNDDNNHPHCQQLPQDLNFELLTNCIQKRLLLHF